MITHSASRALHCRLAVTELRLAWLPRPHLIIFKGEVTRQPLHAAWQSIKLFPGFTPAPFNELKYNKIIIEQPEITLRQAEHSRQSITAAATHTQFPEKLKKEIQNFQDFQDFLAAHHLNVSVINGQLELNSKKRPPLLFYNIDSHFHGTAELFNLNVTCGSSFANQLSLDLTLPRQAEELHGQLLLRGLSPSFPLKSLDLADTSLDITGGPIDLTLELHSDLKEQLQVDFQGRNAPLSVMSNSEQTLLGKGFVNGSFRYSRTRASLRIKQLELDEPRLSMSGELLYAAADQGGVQLRINGENINVDATRRAALTLLGKSYIVRELFHILRGGTAPFLMVGASGDHWSDLTEFKQWRLAGRLHSGRLWAPFVEMDLTDLSGEVSIADGILSVENGRARYGTTTGKNGGFKIDLSGDSDFIQLDLDLAADMSQLKPILERVVDDKAFQHELAGITEARGKAVGNLFLEHNVSNDFFIKVDASDFDIKARYNRLPHPLAIQGNDFHFHNDKISFRDVEAQTLHSFAHQASGTVNWEENIELEITASAGELGHEMTSWLREELGITEEFIAHPPLTFNSSRLFWHDEGKIEFSGRVTPVAGPEVGAQLRFTQHETIIDELTIRDNDSDARFTMRHNREAGIGDLSFQGHLSGASLDNLWKKNEYLKGSINGDLRVRCDLREFLSSSIDGTLEADRILAPRSSIGAFQIDHAMINATGSRVEIINADLDVRNNHFGVNGYVLCRPGSIFMELNGASDELDVTDLKEYIKEFDQRTAQEKPADERLAKPHMLIAVNIKADKLRYDNYIWAPYEATLVLDNKTMTMKINKAELCGIATPGLIKLSPQGLWLEVIPRARPNEMEYTLGCLTGTPSTEQLKGHLKVGGFLTTEGMTSDELLRNLKGELDLSVEKGLIHNAGTVGTFTNLFNFLKINRIVSGDIPDLSNNDFRYNSFMTKLMVDQGKVTLTEGFMDGETINIVATSGEIDMINKTLDANLLICPLKPIDTIIRYTPIIGHILHGTLLAIPLKVKGTFMDPKVSALSPSAYGSRAMDIVKRTLQVPIKIIEPIFEE